MVKNLVKTKVLDKKVKGDEKYVAPKQSSVLPAADKAR